MPSTAVQKSLAAQFTAITGARDKDAQRMLKTTNWNLEAACDSWFNSNGGNSAATAGSAHKSKEKLATLFDGYQSSDPDAMDVDGMMRYMGDLEVDLETAQYLIPLEIVQSPAFGEITKQGFIDGWKALGADTIVKQKQHVQTQTAALSRDSELFKKVYKHAFIASKEKGAKALPLENAIVFWDLIFKAPGPQWKTASTDWSALWAEYLTEKFTKTVNKDMWNQTLEFYRKTIQDETLSFWSEDGAWPGVIDEFVAYAKLKRGDVPETMETD